MVSAEPAAAQAKLGFETIAIDMPVCGVTEIVPGALVAYDDWLQAGSDFIDVELAKDGRPIVLYGLSAGGMLTYHVAALNKRVKGIVGMTFLDAHVQQVADETTLNLFMSRIGVSMAHLTAKTRFAGMRMPMRLATKMHTLVNDQAALQACFKDKTSAGNWVTMKFISSLMSYKPVTAPEDFDVCPILLTQPAEDRWTPLYLSELFLKRIKSVPVHAVMLDNAGHYPLEQPGLTQMRDEIANFIRVSCKLSSPADQAIKPLPTLSHKEMSAMNPGNTFTESLTRVNFLDKINARTLMLVTPEYSEVKRLRGSGYGKAPTLARMPAMPCQTKVIDGVKIRYAHASNPGKPTVILLTPLPQSILAFAPIWSRLAQQCDLYAYDMPGFGRSDGGVEFMNFTAQGKFLSEFIAAFNIQSPHLVGPDVGMGAALAYVVKNPDAVASLMIGDGPGASPGLTGSVLDKMAKSAFWRMVFRIAGPGAFVEAGNRVGYLNYVPNEEEVSDYIRGCTGRIGPITQWFVNYPTSLASVNPGLSEIKKPVLIFWGDEDKILPVDNANTLHKQIKHSRLHVFKHCGHFSYQDKADEFADLVCRWVGGEYSQE
jgi:pimeloyl-ACP methyl ester carboxylesterase